MRGVWWSALALLLLAVATDAIRAAQEEGASRINRRHPSSSRSPTSTNKPEDVQSTPRPRASRRGDRHEEILPRDVSRTRQRSKSPETTSSVAPDLSINQSEKSERFDSRRTNVRSRNKPVIKEQNFDATVNRETSVKSRSRQLTRHSTTTTTPTPIPDTSNVNLRSQMKVADSTTVELSKTVQKETTAPGSTSKEFRRRSSIAQEIELVTPTPARARGRINTRTNIRTLDLDVSGTANALTTAPKEPTTARSNDLRNSRKLRYRTRPSETDTNLTGEGIILNEVKSSQTRENVTSQPELKSVASSSTTTEKNIKLSTEKLTTKTTTGRPTKVVKRPLSRGKAKGIVKEAKSKVSDEIGEDDNYPPNFKALIQAKNASTQASSPPSESLSVKASQKVFKTHPTSSQLIITAPDTEKHSRLRNKKKLEDDNEIKSDETTQVETTPLPDQPKVKSAEYRLRGSYTPRNKKSSTFASSTSSSRSFNPVPQSSYKFTRKFKPSSTEVPKTEVSSKSNRSENNSAKKSVARSSFFPRRNITRNFNVSTEAPKPSDPIKNINDKSANIFKAKQTLPRTSYYSRLRSTSSTLSTISNIQEVTEAITVAEKSENTADTPLIFTNSNNPTKSSKDEDRVTNESQKFIITVNSKESSENSTDNEIVSKMEESQSKPIINVISTTQKYHATYKEKNNDVGLEEQGKSTITIPPIRNIQTRKYSRKPYKNVHTTPRSKERNLKKYSDTFSKTTEASSNGIYAEPEKNKNKFSSKYRASYLDKPFYKPTVPSITSSTAWLKFFVTDHLLTKSVEEPNWFEEDFLDVTTEQMPRPNDTSPICVHEPALVPVNDIY